MQKSIQTNIVSDNVFNSALCVEPGAISLELFVHISSISYPDTSHPEWEVICFCLTVKDTLYEEVLSVGAEASGRHNCLKQKHLTYLLVVLVLVYGVVCVEAVRYQTAGTLEENGRCFFRCNFPVNQEAQTKKVFLNLEK